MQQVAIKGSSKENVRNLLNKTQSHRKRKLPAGFVSLRLEARLQKTTNVKDGCNTATSSDFDEKPLNLL